MPYDINEHKHRFSAWAESRAASTMGCRFSVRVGKQIIETIGLESLRVSRDLCRTRPISILNIASGVPMPFRRLS